MELTHEYLTQMLAYDARTGLLTWRHKPKGKYGKPGSKAGSIAPRTGHYKVGIGGKTYQASQLVHFYMVGEWAGRPLGFADNNPQNLKWRNIIDPKTARSSTAAARYKREMYAVDKAARALIVATPGLSAAYNSSPENSRSVLRQVRREIRAERRAKHYNHDYNERRDE